jgi:hypothetical protein
MGTLLFNQVGRRILFVGDKAVPDIWENPRPLLDIQLAQKILKRKGEIKVNVSDIFNVRAYFYHDLTTIIIRQTQRMYLQSAGIMAPITL